jgi:2-methylcitrate dehydratase PrpD
MALDYDDYLYMGHTGHSSVLGSWAVAEEIGADTRALLVAQVAANELEGRLGASVVLGPQNGQAWSFIHAAGAAAAAARLYGLDEAQTAHAIAIALFLPPFTMWPGFMGSSSKVLTAAIPTVTGIQAAQLAREGMTGALDVIEAPREGFWASFSYAPMPRAMDGLGEGWVTDTLAYKAYPGCAYIDTTMDALLDAHAHAGRPPAEKITAIEVEASLLTVEMNRLAMRHAAPDGRLDPIHLNFSIPGNAAICVLAGRLGAAEMALGFLTSRGDEIRALAARVTLRHDWEMSARVVESFDGTGGARLGDLSPGELWRVARGYLSRMGSGGLDLGRAPVGKMARALFERATRGGGDAGQSAGFESFRMVVPAQVTIVTDDGARTTSRQDVAFGAPGQERLFETVVDKYRREALSGHDAARAIEVARRLEDVPLDEATRAFCAPKA